MATKQQIPVLVARLTEFQEDFLPLPDEVTQWVIMNTKEAIPLIVKALINRKGTTIHTVFSPIISSIISSVTIAATDKKFVAGDKFVVNTGPEAEVKIYCITNNFMRWFGHKVEEPFTGSIIYGRKLGKNFASETVLDELGGARKARTSLSEVYAMMKRQPNGENGNLTTDISVNTFYVPDDDSRVEETLRKVDLDWYKGGWRVSASLVTQPLNKMYTECRIFSRSHAEPRII